MILHRSHVLSLDLDSTEYAKAEQLFLRLAQLGQEACGSPAHRQALDDLGEFARQVAIGNAARGDSWDWDWAPEWKLKPGPGGGEVLWAMMGSIWRDLRQRSRGPAPPRAAVVPLTKRPRHKG